MGMSTARSQIRLEAAGAAPDQAMATLPSFYHGSDWTTSATERPYTYRYSAVGDAGMTFRTSRMQGSISGDIPPGDDYVVQWITGGDALVDIGRDAVRLRPGRPMLFPAHRPFVFRYADYDQKLVHLGRDRVADVAAERYGIEAGTLRFDHRPAPSASSTAVWLDTVTLAYRALTRGDVSDLLWHEVTRMAILAFLEMYPPLVADQGDSAPPLTDARVRRVLEHIHANAELPLTTTGLAEVAEVSVRTLQDAFARHVGASPMTYLRGVRFDRAREELLRTSPDETTIGDVARRWGFAHLGRFSVDYRRRFGERPSETLRG